MLKRKLRWKYREEGIKKSGWRRKVRRKGRWIEIIKKKGTEFYMKPQ